MKQNLGFEINGPVSVATSFISKSHAGPISKMKIKTYKGDSFKDFEMMEQTSLSLAEKVKDGEEEENEIEPVFELDDGTELWIRL